MSPSTIEELVEAVRSTPRLLAFGAGTKPRLSETDVPRISTARLRGVIEHEPSEFVFTALAGTPLAEIAGILARRGQYLPFDPMLAESGATLGGTVAAGLNGPGAFRFGGLRDFVLGVRFVDGSGRLLRLGGKVVKNAAGFDVPKFFVGSLGRFGVMVELTFKVFPFPESELTLRLAAADAGAVTRILVEAAAGRWEPDALDAAPLSGGVFIRLRGPAAAANSLAGEILRRHPGETLEPDVATAHWREITGMTWAPAGSALVKLAITPGMIGEIVECVRRLAGADVRLSVAGNVAYVAVPQGGLQSLVGWIGERRIAALMLRGRGPLRPGAGPAPAIERAVKAALDPVSRFPSLDESQN